MVKLTIRLKQLLSTFSALAMAVRLATMITGLCAVPDLVTTVINKMCLDMTEAEMQKLAAAVLMVQGHLDNNKSEAAHPSVFVAGWRPAIGWVCGLACVLNWIAPPVVKVALAGAGYQLALAPADLAEMLPIPMGMKGLGGLRTVEKINWVAGRKGLAPGYTDGRRLRNRRTQRTQRPGSLKSYRQAFSPATNIHSELSPHHDNLGDYGAG